MNVVVTGGTGFIGRALVRRLVDAGHHVTVLVRRDPGRGPDVPGGVTWQKWDVRSGTSLAAVIETADAVVNLAGEPIAGKRWTARQKERIVRSRVDATTAIVEAIRGAGRKPAVMINASAVGYYGPCGDEDVPESAPKGRGFLSETTAQWEDAARSVESAGVRLVLLRIGVVLGEGGGALGKMLLPFKLFLGGPIGTGRQWFPWIHLDDVVGVMLFALERRELSGPVNLAAPENVTMRGFSTALSKALHRPSWLPVPGFALRILLGEMSGMLLTGQKVRPDRLMSAGYPFKHPGLEEALRSVLRDTR